MSRTWDYLRVFIEISSVSRLSKRSGTNGSYFARISANWLCTELADRIASLMPVRGKSRPMLNLVLVVTREIAELRAELIWKGVPMREVKLYPGFPGPLCDGEDPEGNIFQLQQG